MSVESDRRKNFRLKKIAAKYRNQGYEVTVEPSAERLPPELQEFRPDLIATSANDRVIVEVRSHRSFAAPPDMSRLAQVAERLGWHFELAVTNPRDKMQTEVERLDTQKTRWRVHEATLLEASGHSEAAFLLLWSSFEAGARHWLGDRAVRRTESTPRLVKTLYSLGGLTQDEFEFLQDATDDRNRLVHGFQGTLPDRYVAKLSRLIERLLETKF